MNALGHASTGDVLGRYELLMPIARGGMATVWAARLKGSRGFQKIVAIKAILPDLIEDPRFDEMFLDEASLASRIHHPHVVEILDLGEQDGTLYLVMEWVDGEPLSVVIKAAAKTGGIPLPIAVRIASQACAGLHAAHELRDDSGELLGLVHRDVSPQNLMITFEGVVKVVDFGVAKAAGRASAATTAGQVKGKAAYMSPEQASGCEIDRRTDLFALGIILYLMTTGHHPFRGDNDAVTIQRICNRYPVVRPSQLVPNYPPGLEAVVLKALARDPNLRYATANDFLRALEHSLPTPSRIVTDDVLAKFMHGLLEQRHEQRKRALKAAQLLADERGSGLSLHDAVSGVDSISHSGFTPISTTSIGAAVHKQSQPSSASASGRASGMSLSPPVGDGLAATLATNPTVVDPVGPKFGTRSPSWRRQAIVSAAIAISGAVVWLAIAAGVGTNSRSGQVSLSAGPPSASTLPVLDHVGPDSTSRGTEAAPVGSTTARVGSTTAATTASGGADGFIVPGAHLRADDAPTDSPSAAAMDRRSGRPPGAEGSAAPRSDPAQRPTTKKKGDSSPTFVSPVRNPGF